MKSAKLCAVLLVGLSLLGASAVHAQSIGSKYQARDPRTCASKTEPADGPITAAEATQYFICQNEFEQAESLLLVSDVTLEVGKGTPFMALGEGSRPGDADPDGLVYAIRGSFKWYHCSAPSGFTPAGQQCFRVDQPKATGNCYRTSFGDWSCNMADLTAIDSIPDQPPPQ